MNFDKQYFIDKFDAIPEDEIGTGSMTNKCALWHCGLREYDELTEEAAALIQLFGGKVQTSHIGIKVDASTTLLSDFCYVYEVNDNRPDSKGTTAKQRILTKLNSL